MDSETAAWNRAKAETCPRLDSCQRIAMVMDKDILILDAQAAEAIGVACEKCKGVI